MALSDKEVSNMTGEDGLRKSKYELPGVRLNGKDGVFIRYNPETKEERPIPEKTITGIMLRHRRVCSVFGEETSMFTNEHNSWKDKVALLQRKKTANGKIKIELVEEGQAKEIKDKYKLKMTQLIYLLVGEEIVKLRVTGKGLSNLFDFFNVFEKGEHMWQYEIQIGIDDYKNKLGTFYGMTFARKEMISDRDLVVTKIEEVNKEIENIESYSKEKEIERNEKMDGIVTNAEMSESEVQSDIPVIDEDEDNINVEDIPF